MAGRIDTALPLALMTATLSYLSGMVRGCKHGRSWACDLAGVVDNDGPLLQD